MFCFVLFFFFAFLLFKTNDISFGSTKIGIFYQEKAFHAGEKNQEKNDFALSEKYVSYASGRGYMEEHDHHSITHLTYSLARRFCRHNY